ncbi:MAG TPA: cyclopropane fatty acyl phospholipid synthase [Bryobacteraceae bacterium]|nr:cyclopropane fatty acyl phospholipid synthase [Bryobacteraceae bacterium]
MSSGSGPDLRSLRHPVLSTHGSAQRAEPVSGAAKIIIDFLASAGIDVNGSRPWDIQVHDPRFYPRVLSDGSLGAGESYMDGWWDVGALDEFFTKVHRADPYYSLKTFNTAWLALKSRLVNRQAKWRSTKVARQHYDLGNDIYEAMLDPRMQYTCAYWKDATTLEEAQENKLRLVCEKIHLRPGMRVLELGGGFGGLAHFIAARYGCEVVSYNISHEQVAYARNLCGDLPVRFEQKDYREAVSERAPFDRVVAVGLCEHIGYKNYRTFLEIAERALKPGGLFLLHTIGSNESYTSTDAWVDKYIFPNGMVPSLAQLGKAMEGLWVAEDWHNFGPDYDKTLLAWWSNFSRAWPSLRSRYSDRFYRMWKFYLMGSAGRFRARKLQLWQFVLSKGDIPNYVPVR